MTRALESLRTVRQGEEAAAHDRLVSEQRALEAAEAEHAIVRAELESAEARLAEAVALPAATASERGARDAFASRRRRERTVARERHEATSARCRAQAERVEAAREALALAHAEKRVAELHLARAVDARRREAERREDD